MNRTLLIAEADADLRDSYRALFNQHGYNVDMAFDGLECLAKIRQAAPDLLILDQQIPWGGGDGVLARLRESRAFRGPVIFTASERCCPTCDNYEELPVVSWLTKPLAFPELFEIVQSAMEPKSFETRGLNSLSIHSELFIG